MENKELNRTNSRSRRSHANLANLRLAPLSTDFNSNIPPVSDTTTGYQTHHSSYIQGKSAPSTPGILARSSSRRRLGAGLSQKLSWQDTATATATPNYAAVLVNREGVPLSTRSADTVFGLPKAQSDAALLTQRRSTAFKLHTQLSPGAIRHHRSSQTGGRRDGKDDKEEDWFTRAAWTTTSLLREGKGQSWLNSRHSTTSLHENDASSDDDDADVETLSYLSASSHLHLHLADDELSPETPRYTSRWGSRFGSRAASARNSRRGSNAELVTPTIAVPRDGYFGGFAQRDEELVGPDFVDGDEGDGEDPEEEIARLARERSSGFVGGLVDRLVGWSLFDVGEDREGTDVEDEGGRDGVKITSRPLPARNRQVLGPGHAIEEPLPERQEEGGWHDAAWLLSLASKVIL